MNIMGDLGVNVKISICTTPPRRVTEEDHLFADNVKYATIRSPFEPQSMDDPCYISLYTDEPDCCITAKMTRKAYETIVNALHRQVKRDKKLRKKRKESKEE